MRNLDGKPLQPHSNSEGKHHVAKGWEKAEITKLVNVKPNLSPDDPLEDIEGAIQIYMLNAFYF